MISSVTRTVPQLQDIVEDEDNNSSSSNSNWKWMGYNFPKGEAVFFSQVIILYTVVLSCIVNLSISGGEDKDTLWVALLSSCLGYMLPNPSLKNRAVHKV